LAEAIQAETPEHAHLKGQVIFLVTDRMSGEIGGKASAAGGKLLAAIQSYHPDIDLGWIITLSLERWNEMTEAERRALLDHEMCHCKRDEKFKPIIAPHDVEEFGACVQRNGLWTDHLRKFGRTIEQLELFAAEAEPTSRAE